MALVKKQTPPDRDIQRLFHVWANLEKLLTEVVGRRIFKYPMADIISLAHTVEKANNAYWDLVYKKHPHLIHTGLTGKGNGAIHYEEEEPDVELDPRIWNTGKDNPLVPKAQEYGDKVRASEVDTSKPVPNGVYRDCQKCGKRYRIGTYECCA